MSRTQFDLVARSKLGPTLGGVEVYLLAPNGSLDRAPDLSGLSGSARAAAIVDFLADETLVTACTTDPVALADEADDFAATVAEVVDLGAVGHTWGDRSIFNGPAVAAFHLAHA